MRDGPIFPAFLKIEHQPDAAAKASFLAEMASFTTDAKRQFDRDFGEIRQVISKSLTSFQGGKVALDIDVSGLRQTAAEADLTVQKLRLMRDSATSLASSTGDTSASTQRYLSALRAQVIEAERSQRAADAQVTTYSRLQAEIDKQVAGNTRLAQSYREVYAEQARVENSAFRSQASINTAISPTLAGTRATDNGAGFGALAEMARYSEQADRLRQALDPAIVVQQRFDRELAHAKTLVDAGAISQREYGNAVDLARNNLQDGWTALTRANAAAVTGTEVNARLARSQAGVRMATIGAGQQLQDLAISLASGQRAGTVFAQQLPQLGFALSALDGNANRALARVGAFGTMLSGPWGLAVVGASVVAGPLIEKFLGLGEESKKTTNAFESQADKLNLLKNSYEEVIAATRDYNREQARSRETSLASATATALQTKKNIEEAISRREQVQARLEEALKSSPAINTYTRDDGTVVQGRDSWKAAQIRKEMADNAKELGDLRKTALNAQFTIIDEFSKRDSDATYRITEEYKERRRAVADSLDTEINKRRVLNRLRAEEKAAIEAANKAERDTTRSPSRETASFAMPVSGTITSGFGPRRAPTAGASTNHPAIDIAAPVGTPVRAPQVGTVKAIGFDPGLGKYVVIDHGAGTTSRFGHLSDNSVVREGQKVEQGDVIGKVGSTGRSTGPHLDYQVKVNGKPVDPRKGMFPIDAVAVSEKSDRAIKQQADQIARLGEFANDAATRVLSIGRSFANTPPAIARVTSAMDQLRDIADDIDQRVKDGLDPKIADALRAQIEQAKAVASTGADQPFRDMVQSAKEFDAVQRMLVDGQQVSAEVLERGLALQRDQGVVTEGQLADIRAIVVQEKLRAAELTKQNALRQRDAQLIDDTQANVNSLFQDVARGGGMTSVGKALKRQFDILQTSAIDGLTSTLFGDMFANAKDRALGFDKVKEASLDQAAVARRLSAALDELRVSAGAAATELTNRDTGPTTLESRFDAQFGVKRDAIPGASAVAAVVDAALGRRPANDNADKPITVTAGYQPRAFLGKLVEGIADIFVAPATAKRMGEGFAKGLSGDAAAYGSIAGGLVLGGSNSRLGSAIGGAVGEAIGGKALSKGLEGIAKGLGDFGGPLASIAGGIIGSVIGGLFTKTPKASSTIGTGSDGTLQVVSTQGTSNALRQASSKSATEALDTLDRIAEALGANIDASAGRVSIGVRKGNYRVDTTGSGQTKVKKGAVDFGEDSAAAIKFATMDLIKDGVLTGLRASTQRILQQGTDLDRAIQKAVDFESVFTRLKEYRDPVGAALDTLDKGFVRLQTVFKEAGASAAEYADLEALYALDRAKAIDEANQRVVGSLKSLLSDLNTGDTGLSLRDREAAARATYDPLAARVRAGDVTANDAYAEAAQKLLDLERQIYGSQQGYFDFRNEVKTLSQTMVDAQEALATASANRDSPFSTTTSAGTDNASVVGAIEDQTSKLIAALGGELSAVNDNLISLVKQGVAGGSLAAGMGFETTF